jgi:iron-sulfur cluster assembly protein
MAVTLTQSAADRAKKMLNKRGKGIGLKVSTKVSGCAGFSYVVDYADEITNEDDVFESFGIKVVVPKENLPHIEGMELDYVIGGLLNEGFEFNNPQVKDSCGCGTSFST